MVVNDLKWKLNSTNCKIEHFFLLYMPDMKDGKKTFNIFNIIASISSYQPNQFNRDW
jgi:hypothetical protein